MRRVNNLQALALLLGQALIISDFHDQRENFLAKLATNLIWLGASIFNRVMQQGRRQDHRLSHAAGIPENIRHLNRVVDVRWVIAAFTALVAVFLSGKAQRFEKE